MVLKDPYDSKILKLLNKSTIISNINRYIITDYAYLRQREKIKFKPFKNEYLELTPVVLYGLTDIEKEITPFNHPLINLENKWIALDLRSIVSVTKDKEDYSIRNTSEYELAIERFILTGMWYIGKQDMLYGYKLPHIAFGNWLSENLARKFGLDLTAQMYLKILSLIYYSKLFTEEFTSDDYTKLVIRLKDEIIVPKLVDEVYSKIEKLDDIDDFCRECYNVTGNIRLKNLDYNVLINIINNNWFGLNGKELVMLSLEHPATWISLCYAAITQRSFNKNFIGNIVDKLNRRGRGEEFIKALSLNTKDYRS
jgi:hypothetical protein